MSTKIVLAASSIVAILSGVLAVALPAPAASVYTRAVEPGLLLAASALSFYAAPMYRGELRKAFLFLAAFLLLYSLVTVIALVDAAALVLDGAFLPLLLAYQTGAYACLIAACWYILRGVDAHRLDRAGWAATVVSAALGVVIFFNAMNEGITLFAGNDVAVVIYLLIRVFDCVVFIMLMPVLWLYLQHSRARYRESATFAFVAVGLIASLVMAYLYELASGQPLAQIASVEYQTGSLLDAFYIFGYVLLVTGLFAHRKHQDWSFANVEKQLA